MAEQRIVWIIPGFMGSELRKVPGHGRVRSIWLNKTEMAVNGPDNMDLEYPGPAPGPLANGPLTPGGGVQTGLYEPLMTRLAELHYIPQFWAYDWRLSLDVLGQQLANTLMSTYETQPLYFVAHSYGGLILRWAWHIFRQFRVVDRWRRSVYLGVPHGGTYDAVSGLCGWSPELSLTSYLAVSVGLLVRRVLSPLGDRTPLQERYNRVLASWPALYDMMPAASGPWSGLDPKIGETLKVANFTGWNPHVTQERLDAGAARRSQLIAWLAEPQPSSVCVWSRGQRTSYGVGDPAFFGAADGYNSDLSGDGCVTQTRATLSFAGSLEVDSTHQQLASNARLLANLDRILEGLLPYPAFEPTPEAPVVQPTAPPFVLVNPPSNAIRPLNPTPPRPLAVPSGQPTPVNWPLPVRYDP